MYIHRTRIRCHRKGGFDLYFGSPCVYLKIFGRGSGRDCRLHVQRLNERRMKGEVLGNNNFPFQEECNEHATPVSCVLEDKARCNGELLCFCVYANYFTRYVWSSYTSARL
jgi:hypothetical protein